MRYIFERKKTGITMTTRFMASALMISMGVATSPLTLNAQNGATPAAPVVSAPIFTDVAVDAPHAIAIAKLKSDGVIKGFPDGSFKPNAPITRAETVAILLKLTGITAEKTNAKLPFSDVASDSWFFPMIQKTHTLNKIKGFEDGTFKPLNPITLPEALALSFTFLNIDTRQTTVEGSIYMGLDAKAWYAKQAQYAKNMFILTPNLLGASQSAEFSATLPLTRAELAEIVYRSRQVKTTGTALDITAGWATTEYAENYWRLRHPASWTVFKGTTNSVLWNRKAYSSFFTRVWPTGVRLSLSIVENENKLQPIAYFDMIKQGYTEEYGAGKVLFFSQTVSGRSGLKIVVPDMRIIDIHVSLPNNKFLTMYGEYGSAPIGEYLKKELELVVASYQYVEPPVVIPKPVIPLERRMEILRENILIEGGWKTVKDLFEDKKLIYTDGIGAGTGPIDYFFTVEGGNTIKVERSTSTILNIRENETHTF